MNCNPVRREADQLVSYVYDLALKVKPRTATVLEWHLQHLHKRKILLILIYVFARLQLIHL